MIKEQDSSSPRSGRLPRSVSEETGGVRSTARRIVLVGAGHVNASLLSYVPGWRKLGWEVDIIAPGPFVYSGLATGVLSGDHEIGANVVDLADRARALGARYLVGRLASLNNDPKELVLEDGRVLPFDVVSLNLGSSVQTENLSFQGAEGVFTAKPTSQLAALRQQVESDLTIAKMVVVGAGVAGVEIACCLAGLRSRLTRMIELRLIAPDGPLPDWSERGRSIARSALDQLGVLLVEGERAKRIRKGEVVLGDGSRLKADLILSAVGVKSEAKEAFRWLEFGPRGGLAVDWHLQAKSMSGVFAGGDFVDTDPLLDRVGVYAVREARIIAQNMTASLEGRPLRLYRPQKRYLQILNLGDGSGLLRWGSIVLRSRWALQLKNALDQRFLDKIRHLGR